MATNILNKYGANGQAITITLASLTNASARASTAVDNSSNNWIDALLELQVKSGASGTSATGTIEVYGYGSANGGTTYTESATGTDAGITLTSPTNARLIGVFNIVANATTYVAGPFSVSNAFGGSLPDHWGIIVVNKSGGTLDTTGGNFSVFYQGVYAQGS